ncbi:methionyl-tRNA formyltransferase, partial [Shigella sonnei]|nr:methionyl-tRNA formyltransferase [Shigella sonnei]
ITSLACSSIGIKIPKRLKKHHEKDVSSTPLVHHMSGNDY